MLRNFNVLDYIQIMTNLKLLILVSLYFFITSCESNSTVTNEELKNLIIEKYSLMATSLQKGESDYIINLHTDDAVLFKADGTELKGIDELSELYKQVAASGIMIKSKPITVELFSKDIAFEVGTFVATMKDGQTNSAKYMIIWKRVGKDWKIYKSIDQAKLK